MDDTMIRGTKRRHNRIYKRREEGGTWIYTVKDRDENTLSELRFDTGRVSRLSNADLLEIVRDRLEALNTTPSASYRSKACLEHVIAALLWADLPAHIGNGSAAKADKTIENENAPENPDEIMKGDNENG